MKETLHKICEQNLRYNPNKRKNKGAFDILNKISENITLAQLMETLVNASHATRILDY